MKPPVGIRTNYSEIRKPVFSQEIVFVSHAVYSFFGFCDNYILFSVRYEIYLYRVIHKSLRDFRTLLRNNQDRHGRKEHINR